MPILASIGKLAHLASIGKEVSSSSEYREVSSHLARISEVVGNVYLVKEG